LFQPLSPPFEPWLAACVWDVDCEELFWLVAVELLDAVLLCVAPLSPLFEPLFTRS
jgi:hypothetical protein